MCGVFVALSLHATFFFLFLHFSKSKLLRLYAKRLCACLHNKQRLSIKPLQLFAWANKTFAVQMSHEITWRVLWVSSWVRCKTMMALSHAIQTWTFKKKKVYFIAIIFMSLQYIETHFLSLMSHQTSYITKTGKKKITYLREMFLLDFTFCCMYANRHTQLLVDLVTFSTV